MVKATGLTVVCAWQSIQTSSAIVHARACSHRTNTGAGMDREYYHRATAFTGTWSHGDSAGTISFWPLALLEPSQCGQHCYYEQDAKFTDLIVWTVLSSSEWVGLESQNSLIRSLDVCESQEHWAMSHVVGSTVTSSVLGTQSPYFPLLFLLYIALLELGYQAHYPSAGSS